MKKRYVPYALIAIFLAQPVFAQEVQKNNIHITQEIRDVLEHKASFYNAEPEIVIDLEPLYQKKDCDKYNIEITGNGKLKSNTTLLVNCYAPTDWRTYVKANIKLIGQHLVAAKTINKGEALTENDLDVRELDILKNKNHVDADADIYGWSTKRRIAKGSAIRLDALQDPESITRGSKVNAVVQGDGFAINSSGQAMNDAQPGEQVKVRMSSGKVITGVVLNSNTVQIIL